MRMHSPEESGYFCPSLSTVTIQVAPATHWSELEILILVVSAERKMVSSTAGMQASVRTSQLLKVC